MDDGRWTLDLAAAAAAAAILSTVYCLLFTEYSQGLLPLPLPPAQRRQTSIPAARFRLRLASGSPSGKPLPLVRFVTVTWPFSAAGATCCPLAGLWCRPSFRGGLSHSTRHRQPYQAIFFRLPQALLYSEKDGYLKSKESKRKEKNCPCEI